MEKDQDGQCQKFGGRTITGGSSSSGIARGTRRTGRCEITGASSMLGTGGVTIVSPEGNRRTQFPFGVVPTTLADSEPTRSGGSGRAEDLAMRLRSDLVLEAVESACFLLTTCSEGFGGSLAGVAVGKESFAAVAVRSGMSAGGISFFSAGGGSALIGAWLVSDGPCAGTGGSAIRLLAAN